MDSKPWYESRTIWLNVASLVVLALNHFVGFGDFSADPWVAELFGGVVAFVNVWLRTKTSVAIAPAA